MPSGIKRAGPDVFGLLQKCVRRDSGVREPPDLRGVRNVELSKVPGGIVGRSFVEVAHATRYLLPC